MNEAGEAERRLLLDTEAVTVAGAVPVFETVTVRVAVVPKATSPKSTVAGATERLGATPLPITFTAAAAAPAAVNVTVP